MDDSLFELHDPMPLAAELADEFERTHAVSPLRPRVLPEQSWDLNLDPIVHFRLVVDIEEDFDVADYPGDEVARLLVELRALLTTRFEQDWAVSATSPSSSVG